MRAPTAGITDLSPPSFGIVMATGIVSIAARFVGLDAVAWALFAVNVVAYVVLWVLTLLRAGRCPSRLAADLGDHERGPVLFTVVAATSVLGRQVELLTGDARVSVALWVVAVVLWAGLMYGFLAAVMVREPKPSLAGSLNGAWLLIVVATESITVLGALVADHFEATRHVVLFFMLATYLLGAMLYVILISLIFQRLAFFPLPVNALTPPYWINMGALAITTLAGSTLILKSGEWVLLRDGLPFLAGFTLLFWVTGTWWIPLLAILGVWRHVVKRVPIVYDPQYWSLVFPLGMYTAGTFQLARALGVPFLLVVPRVFVWVALATWTLTFVGLLRRLIGRGAAAAADARP